jgi:hypothetical protein
VYVTNYKIGSKIAISKKVVSLSKFVLLTSSPDLQLGTFLSLHDSGDSAPNRGNDEAETFD